MYLVEGQGVGTTVRMAVVPVGCRPDVNDRESEAKAAAKQEVPPIQTSATGDDRVKILQTVRQQRFRRAKTKQLEYLTADLVE